MLWKITRRTVLAGLLLFAAALAVVAVRSFSVQDRFSYAVTYPLASIPKEGCTSYRRVALVSAWAVIERADRRGPGISSRSSLFHAQTRARTVSDEPYEISKGKIILPGFRYSWWLATDDFTLAVNMAWPILLLLLLPAVAGLRWRRYRRRYRLKLCLRCGYDLRGSVDRCPECAEPIGTRASAETSV